MKVTGVEAVRLSAPLAERDIVRWSGGQFAVAGAVLALLHTDEGLDGIGDTYTGGWLYPEPACALIEHFAEIVVGEDPQNVALLAERMRASCRYWGRVGAAINAISAIENALWDIAGKAVGQPVWRLLGGLAHERLPFYASGGLEKSHDAVVSEMRQYVKAGVPAVKIRIPTDWRAAADKVALCRESLGRETALMVDAVMGSHPSPWDERTAVQFAHAIEQYDITWLEEPCAADNYEGLAKVRQATSIPISGGETSFGLSEYEHFFTHASLDIVQPDACTSGGLLECTRIAAAAAAHNVRVAPHAWGSGATIMANLHWAFTQPNVVTQEFPTWGSPLRDVLLAEPLRFDGGFLLPPTKPGLGLRLTREIREAYPWQKGGHARLRKN